MDQLATFRQDALSAAQAGQIEQAERAMLAMPQADCPLAHHFGPGVYIRELSMKAGTWAIGHRQRFEHLNILLQGSLRMDNADGSTTDLQAPMIFTGQPGRKIGYVLEDMVWLNVYAADERDVDALEARFVEKSQAWLELAGARLEQQIKAREADRLDFAAQPMDPVQGRDVDAGATAFVRPSAIHGMGAFVPATVEAFHTVGCAVSQGIRSALGRYLNHSTTPNAILVRRPDGDVDIVALVRIRGPQGGQLGDEVTIDYEQAARLFNQHKELLP